MEFLLQTIDHRLRYCKMPPENTIAYSSDAASSSVVSDVNADAIQVDDKIYSAKILSSIHPGGDLFVKAFAGRDATEAFMSYHRRKFPHNSVASACVGSAKSTRSSEYMSDYLELCKIVEKVLPRHKSFAPFTYYIKLFAILLVVFGGEFYIHYTKSYVWYLTGPLGFFMALIGLNIQHDANHGAISKTPFINRILGLSQNWIGGASVDWIHQHVVQHHINTNDVNLDPDIRGSGILRLNPLRPLMGYQVVQHIYVFFLITIFGAVMIGSSFVHVVSGENMSNMSSMLKKERLLDSLSFFLFVFRWIVIPLSQKASVYTILQITPMLIVGGYYLAFFFLISHNFEGVHMFDNTRNSGKSSFLWDQVTSSSNVGGSWLCFLNGGLNYQIEHHLFPRVQHSHYPKIAPVVRQFCEERNIPYVHFNSVYDNFTSCVRHLALMGSREIPANFRRKN